MLYPNPANFELNLAQVPVGSIISITDINGKEIYYEQVNKNQTKINTSDFVNGVYFVHVSNNEYSSIQKFIVVQ